MSAAENIDDALRLAVEVAGRRREIRGDFRRIIVEATRAYAEKLGGRVIAEAYDGVEFKPAELNAAAGIKS